MPTPTDSETQPLTSIVVIPARLDSTRLPRKLLLAETGKPLIQHTYEAASRATRPRSVCIATDSQELFDAVRGFGGQAVMTRPDHQSGTDRVAEVAAAIDDVDVVVNVQGDEPEISGESIDFAVRLLEQNPDVPMATLAVPIREPHRLDDPACVKVVLSDQGRALYFSRATIPFARDWADDLLTSEPPRFLQHVGLYAYRRDFLLKLTRMPPASLEQLEKLEQLRVIQAGIPIQVGTIKESLNGIDTPNDYRQFVARRQKS